MSANTKCPLNNFCDCVSDCALHCKTGCSLANFDSIHNLTELKELNRNISSLKNAIQILSTHELSVILNPSTSRNQ